MDRVCINDRLAFSAIQSRRSLQQGDRLFVFYGDNLQKPAVLNLLCLFGEVLISR